MISIFIGGFFIASNFKSSKKLTQIGYKVYEKQFVLAMNE